MRPNAALRALLVDLDAWVSAGKEPPPNVMPSVADGTLATPMPQETSGFPQIPGVVL